MVRDLIVFGGSSHPELTEIIVSHLGMPQGKILLSKFAVGETRVEIGESVRGKDVYIVQTGAGDVNDNFLELLITINACKTASARKITAVLPMFPYSRQADVPYNKSGAPLSRNPVSYGANGVNGHQRDGADTVPPTPQASSTDVNPLETKLSHMAISSSTGRDTPTPTRRSNTMDSVRSEHAWAPARLEREGQFFSADPMRPPADPQRHKLEQKYKQWNAQAGTLIAELLMCSGADHIITMELHDAQYQGFFDIPVDNLYSRHLFRKYVARHILANFGGTEHCVIVSPDAGGAKRATSIADSLNMSFALIHKERRRDANSKPSHATMLLVGDVKGKTAILVDDMADTAATITRAAKLVKVQGAARVIALVTHGIFSGDALERINNSELDKLVVTNSVPQWEHKRKCPKIEVLDVGSVFAEAIRRVHHGESISVLFDAE